jgi:hypothetical protein
VTARAGELRFFADESALGIGKTLTIARRDLVHSGHPLIPEVPLGSTDEEWIPAVAARGLVVISRDRRIRTKPAELAQLRAHSLRVFWIAGRRDLSNWETLVRLVHRWGDIERVVTERQQGPWFYAVNDSLIRELTV